MAKRNANDGSGRGASELQLLTGAVADTSTLSDEGLGNATGMFASTDGTIEVKLLRNTTSKIVPVTSYKDYIWNIESVGAGGTIDLSTVVLFWQ